MKLALAFRVDRTNDFFRCVHYAFTVIRSIPFDSLAFMRGDPHITTIDGKSYTFNGLGEYWLISTSNPVTAGAQVRFVASSKLRTHGKF